MAQPLHDVRIIAIEQYAAGPYGTLHLGELGADVIKIEEPGGEVGRTVPPYRTDNDSLFFQSMNRSKRSVVLDLRRPEGRQVLEDLVRVSDAVFSNLRGDVPAALGIRYDDLKHLNPRIVCCSLSGYGMSGPRASNPGFDYMVQGLTGWMSLTGDPSGPPTKTGLSSVDFATGIVAAASLLVGIHAARRDGVGGDCDVSLYDTALSFLNYLATWHLTEGYQPGRIERSGHPTLVPFGNFPTADGWIVVGGSKAKFWTRLAVALELHELVDDPRFATFDDRLVHRTELQALLDARFLTRGTAQWVELLEDAQVPCAPILSVPDALADEQAQARGLVFRLQHEAFGSVGHVASPVRYGTEEHARRPAPALGADSVDVLRSLLNYDDERIRTLVEQGVTVAP